MVFFMALAILSSAAHVHAQSYSPDEAEQKHKVERNDHGEIIAKNPTDIAEAFTLNDTLDKITINMMGCSAKGGEERDCECEQLPLLKKFQGHLDFLLQRNPDWRKETVSFRTESRDPLSLGFIGLKQQSERVDRLECKKAEPQ